MNSLLDTERDEDIDDRHGRLGNSGRDREITLGTTVILGIFFALAVFAAVFFGFGYSMGAKHAAATAAGPSEANSSIPFNSFKPAPGSPLGTTTTRPAPTDTTPLALTSAIKPAPATRAPAAAFTEPAVEATAPAIPEVKPVPRTALAATVPPPPAPVAAGPATAVVQVAAVSHQEDADLLVNTLKRRGYAVAIRSEPQDKLLHVQIGPFPSKAEATAMRQRLLTDGFNAIVK